MALLEAFRSCWLIAIFGFILLISGTSILFWNEGRAVHKTLSLDEAWDDAVTVDPTVEMENNYNGRIVHLSGQIVIGEPLTEPDYNIQVLAVKLKRRVQMYQWVEESIEHNYGESLASVHTESRTYYYTMEWRDKLIDHRNFYIQTGHKNPEHFPIKSETQVADAVFIGNFELGRDIKDKFNNYVELTSDTRPEDPSIKLHLGLYYHTNDIFHPEIGDIRILFSIAGMEGEFYTIIGRLENNKILPYKTSRGVDILLVHSGELSLEDVFKLEHHAERLMTWSWRFIGWMLVFFGVTCTSKLLTVIMTHYLNFLAFMAPQPDYPIGGNFMLSFSMALIIASIAWVLHRPMVGAGLLFAAASPFMWCARSVWNYQHL